MLNPVVNAEYEIPMNHRYPSGVTTTPVPSSFDETAGEDQRMDDTMLHIRDLARSKLTDNVVVEAFGSSTNQHPLHTTCAVKPGKVTRRRNENRVVRCAVPA